MSRDKEQRLSRQLAAVEGELAPGAFTGSALSLSWLQSDFSFLTSSKAYTSMFGSYLAVGMGY